MRKKRELERIRSAYRKPRQKGSLGGVQRFARMNKLPLKKVQQALERDVAYTLHKPVKRKFPTSKVLVMGIDQQWVADLVDMQKLSRVNRGNNDGHRRIFQICMGRTFEGKDEF